MNKREKILRKKAKSEESHTFNLWMMSDVMFEACVCMLYYIILLSICIVLYCTVCMHRGGRAVAI